MLHFNLDLWHVILSFDVLLALRSSTPNRFLLMERYILRS